MKKIKIFLASSEELKQERLELADFVEHLNHTLEKLDINVQLVKWEYLDSSMGAQHKQEDYNDMLRECEMCIVLYWTKFGLYTKSELDTAYCELKAGNNPKKLYVYFKEIEGEEKITDELLSFRDSFPRDYGHFENRFRNIDTLKSQFLLQFIEYKSKELKGSPLIEVKDGKISMGGKTYVDLMNVPFVGNNDEYTSLLKDIKKTKKLLAVTEPDDEEYVEYADDLRKLEEKKEKMESSLWDTALEITRLSNQKCSERLQRAIDLFNKGDNKGANAILNEEEIYKDAENNINLIKLGEEGRKGLITNIEELKLKVKTLKNEMADGWKEEILKLHEKIIEYTKSAYGENAEEYVEALINGGFLLRQLSKYRDALKFQKQGLEILQKKEIYDEGMKANLLSNISWNYIKLGDYKKALVYGKEAICINKRVHGENHLATAYSFNNLGTIYYVLGNYSKALNYYLKALEIRVDILGERHALTAGSFNNIGSTYQNLGDYCQALLFKKKALELKKEIFGERHPETASGYNNMARIYQALGDYCQALLLQEKALELNRELLGNVHSNTISCLDGLGSLYQALGNYAQAFLFKKKALELKKELYGERHPDTIDSYNGIGWTLYLEKKYKAGLEYAENAVSLGSEILGVKHLRMSYYYDTLGSIYSGLTDYKKALEYKFKSFELRKELLGERHPSIIYSYNSISWTLCLQKNFKDALEYGENALRLGLEILGETHPNMASIYDTIASIFEGEKDYKKALTFFLKAYENANKNKIKVGNRAYKLGEIYIKMNNLIEAKAKFEETITLLPEDHPNALDAKKCLKELR